MHRYSTATLMGMTKKELVEYVRMAEHNQEVAEETLNQQAENVKDWIPVVRCKDCKSGRVRPYSDDMIYCRVMGCAFKAEHFCAYGERGDGNV